MRILIFMVLSLCWPLTALAEDRPVRLHVPQALEETGLVSFMLPRFTLKTQVRVTLVAENAAPDMALGSQGTPVFEGLGQVWHMDVQSPHHAGTTRLADWLSSEVGQRTVASFQVDGVSLFANAPDVVEAAPVAVASAEAERGHDVSRAKCTRCHAVDDATRGWGIGSTPSFGVLRALNDWETRFATFYVLNPHPAFTQITDVTEPFPIDRPSPIAPIELSIEELDALMAYVTMMAAANLGKPLDHQ